MSVVELARGAVGVRFRVHGREAAGGLDCVGLAGFAFGVAVPSGYALRGGEAARIAGVIEAAGLVPGDGDRAGDLLLCAAGPGQWHLAISTGAGVVHACAAARRVVERPGAVPWPVVGRWRASPGR